MRERGQGCCFQNYRNDSNPLIRILNGNITFPEARSDGLMRADKSRYATAWIIPAFIDQVDL